MANKTALSTAKIKRPQNTNYDVRIAAQSYSNIASVLSGFAFAAVILVVQTQLPENSSELQRLRDWSTIGFMIAFFGCILSAFTFSVVSGDEKLSRRSHNMALLGGTGFAISTTFVMWAIVNLLKIFLTKSVAAFIGEILPLFIGISPLFLIFSALDPIYGFERRAPTRKESLKVAIPGYLPFVVVLGLRWLRILPYSTELVSSIFKPFAIISLIVMLISTAWTLSMSAKEADTELKLEIAGAWIFVASCVMATMLLLV